MHSAIWNRDRSLATTWPLTGAERMARRRIEANARDRARRDAEPVQLEWVPEEGRAPYAGRENEDMLA